MFGQLLDTFCYTSAIAMCLVNTYVVLITCYSVHVRLIYDNNSVVISNNLIVFASVRESVLCVPCLAKIANFRECLYTIVG